MSDMTRNGATAREREERKNTGIQISIWIRHEVLDKLERLQELNGVNRNKMVNKLIIDASED